MTTLTYTQFRERMFDRPDLDPQCPELTYVLDQLNHSIQNTPLLERIPSYVAHPNPVTYLRKPAPKDGDFKRTVSLTQIPSVQKDINAIRILINKMTPGDQYANTSAHCIQQLQQVVAFYKLQLHWERTEKDLVDVIYSSCIMSDLYSEMYADFFSKVQETVPELRVYDHLQKNIQDYLAEFKTAERVPAEEYDAFCRMNKRNDVRKQTSTFYTHLYKRGVLTAAQLLDVIHRELTMIQTFLYEESVTPFLEEIEILVDNVSILVMLSQARLGAVLEDEWFEMILPTIYKIAETMYGNSGAKKGNDRIHFAWKRLVEIVEA